MIKLQYGIKNPGVNGRMFLFSYFIMRWISVQWTHQNLFINSKLMHSFWKKIKHNNVTTTKIWNKLYENPKIIHFKTFRAMCHISKHWMKSKQCIPFSFLSPKPFRLNVWHFRSFKRGNKKTIYVSLNK